MTEFSFWGELRPILGSLFYSDEFGMLKANSNDTYQPLSLIILLVSFCLVSDASVFEVSSPPSFLSLSGGCLKLQRSLQGSFYTQRKHEGSILLRQLIEQS